MIQVLDGDGEEAGVERIAERFHGYPDLRRVRTMLSAILPNDLTAQHLRHLLTRILVREAPIREIEEAIALLDPLHWKLDLINSQMIADARCAARWCKAVLEGSPPW